MTVRSYLRAAALAMSCGVLLAGLAGRMPALAQGDDESPVITLKSFDGVTQLRGKLIEYDGKSYRIETALGMMSINAVQVNCEGDGCPQNAMFGARFGVHGSNAMGTELMPMLIEGYADSIDADLVIEVGTVPFERTLRILHEDGREMAAIDLQTRGSATGFRSLASGAADIAMSSRRARDRDMPAMFNAGLTDPRGTGAERVIGLDGLIVITNRVNPIQSISLQDLAMIYSGGITNWSQLGGPDEPITVYAGADETGTFQTFVTLVMAPKGAEVNSKARRITSNIEISDAVAGDPWGIGVTAAAYERAAKALPIRQDCGILSFPTTFAMKTGEYPLSRRLYLYAPRSNMAVHAKKLVEFAGSDEAQKLIAEAGFVSIEVEATPLSDQGARLVHAMTGEDDVPLPFLREFVTDVKEAVRLSTTFRFTPGEGSLDPASQAEAARFARAIADGVYAGKEILLLGFTDAVGEFDRNREVAARRAETVAELLADLVAPAALAKSPIIAKGYGELAPVACNSSTPGRVSNRRVEVWVRDPA